MNRRHALTLGASLAIGAFALGPASLGAMTRRPTARRHPLLASGPMLGPATLGSAIVWLQLKSAGEVELRWRSRRLAHAAAQKLQAQADRDFIVCFMLEGLPAGEDFDYELLVNGEAAGLDDPGVFCTPSASTDNLTFTFGSCMYINDRLIDGLHGGGGDYHILQALARERPDFMLWLGDNWYYRHFDWNDEPRMRRRARHTRGVAELQSLLAATRHYAIWDDHDFGPNDCDGSFAAKDASQRVFDDYWPGRKRPGFPGCCHSFAWGDCEFFMLDDRWFRSPDNAPASPHKTMLGPGQLDWLQQGLAASRATFKFIANGGQMITPLRHMECWGLFAHEQAAFLDFLKHEHIGGVIFLSGDRHAAELLRVDRAGACPLYEFTSSPLTSPNRRLDADIDNPVRVPGTWVADKRNYGRVRVQGAPGMRQAILSCHDSHGGKRWERVIRADELTLDE